MHLSLVISAFAMLAGEATALGINCRGSSTCGRSHTKNAIKQLASFIIGEIETCRTYSNGEHIACITDGNILAPNGGFCAFLQGTGYGASGLAIQELIATLADRTDDVCNNCGSIPYSFPADLGGSNDPGAGILTVNFVGNTDNPCPTGLC
ncbi:killer toxin [Mariannaea sp. PMI_226]|nr:killer toxin [Mariannaea sp. PMI_226]